MTRSFVLALIGALAIAPQGPAYGQAAASPQTAQQPAFDAEAAWAEFEALLRTRYAYVERSDFDVDALLARGKAAAASAPDAVSVRAIMRRVAYAFTDPHLVVGPLGPDDYSVIMTSSDLDVGFSGNRLIVRDVRRGSPAYDAGIRPGQEIVSVDGVIAKAAARAPFGDMLPSPTAGQFDYGATLAVNGKRAGSRVIGIRHGRRSVKAVSLQSASEFARSLAGRPPVEVAMIGAARNIVVLRPANSLGNNATIKAFDDALATAMGAKAVVLDMRDTPSGGNTEVGRSIIGHFVREIRPYQMHRIPALEREFGVPRQYVEYVFPRTPRYEGKVFVLHGRWTGSMGEGIVIGMDAATDAVSVGANMGDLLGGLYNIDLPKSGARVDLGVESLFHVDGTPRENFTADHPLGSADTAPDGSDPAIARVLALLGENDRAK